MRNAEECKVRYKYKYKYKYKYISNTNTFQIQIQNTFAKVLSACERDCTVRSCLATCQQTFTCLPQKPLFAGNYHDHDHNHDYDENDGGDDDHDQ